MVGIMLAPLAVLLSAATPPPESSTKALDPVVKCPRALVTTAIPKANVPLMRKLGEEPPAALIAAVDITVDRCPMMLVLAPGQSTLGRGWTPAPAGSIHPVR